MEKDSQLFKSILMIAISDDEFSKIKHKARYNEDEKKWNIPMFILKQRRVNFPNLPKA